MIEILPGIASTSSALNAERIRMDVVSQNIANAFTSRGPDGQPYQRQQVVFESVLSQQLRGTSALGNDPQTVRVARIESDRRAPRLVYNPNHPDANDQGMVPLPNVNVYLEMVDLISSSRAFEANLAVVKTARNLAMQTLNIGQR